MLVFDPARRPPPPFSGAGNSGVDRLVATIEREGNDKPLVDTLLQARIPRQQIVQAYAGEPVEAPTA